MMKTKTKSQSIKITAEFDSLDSALNAAGYDRDYYGSAIEREVRDIETDAKIKLLSAYTTDRVDRYGLPVVFYVVECPDGIKIVHKFELHSCLSDSPLYAYVNDHAGTLVRLAFADGWRRDRRDLMRAFADLYETQMPNWSVYFGDHGLTEGGE